MPKPVSSVGMNHGFVETHGESVFCRAVFAERVWGEKAQAGVPWEAKVLRLERVPLVHVHGSLSTSTFASRRLFNPLSLQELPVRCFARTVPPAQSPSSLDFPVTRLTAF